MEKNEYVGGPLHLVRCAAELTAMWIKEKLIEMDDAIGSVDFGSDE